MASKIFNKINVFEISSINHLSANDIMLTINDISSKLQEKFEDVSVRYLRKAINYLDLRNNFLSYAKSFKGIDEKNVCIFFLQEHISKLLSNVNRCGKIFETEEEDKTNKKHRKHKKDMKVYVDKILKIEILFDEDYKKSCDGNFCFYYKKDYD